MGPYIYKVNLFNIPGLPKYNLWRYKTWKPALDLPSNGKNTSASFTVEEMMSNTSKVALGVLILLLIALPRWVNPAVPSTFNFHNSIFDMMYAVVGGLFHSLASPIVGATIITFVPEYFRVVKEYEPIITSTAIILTIIFMSMGVLGLIDQRLKLWFFQSKGLIQP
jgi:hypothetical protein